jgi:hypothetical protein
MLTTTHVTIIVITFVVIFCLLARRNIELKFNMTDKELSQYQKYRKTIKNIKSIILCIFLCLTIAWLIMQFWFNIDYFLISSPISFAGIMLFNMIYIFLIYQYCILTKITKKW